MGSSKSSESSAHGVSARTTPPSEAEEAQGDSSHHLAVVKDTPAAGVQRQPSPAADQDDARETQVDEQAGADAGTGVGGEGGEEDTGGESAAIRVSFCCCC